MAPTARASLHSAQPVSGSSPSRTPERRLERAAERRDERRLSRPTNENLTNDGRFSIDLSRVPPGYVLEWKRHTIMAQEDRQNQVTVRKYHWQPVPHKDQPHILGHLCQNPEEHIIVDGMGLYMRPAYLNEDARAEEEAKTNFVLSQQLQSLRMSSKDQVGAGNTYVKKTTVAVPQPVE